VIDEQTDKRRGSFWRELPILVGVAILVAVLVRAFVLQTFYIPSPSMEHTLNVLDRVLVNKLVYDFREPRRGEIVVFKAPGTWQTGTEGEDFIKRIIGVGGDHVVCCDDQERLTINGRSLDEPFIYRDADGTQDPAADVPFDIVVPADRVWVMGDHRSQSADSLKHWQDSKDITEATIPSDAIVGRAFTVFWPVNRATWLSVPDEFAGIPDAPAAK
jgi:signal peptidase I